MKIDFMGISIDAVSMEAAVRRLCQCPASGESRTVFTPNAVMASRARRDEAFRKTLMQADFRFPDGIGVILAARLMGLPLGERIPGIELGEAVLSKLAQTGGRVYFLGGAPGVAAQAAKKIARKYPGLTVCGARHGYFTDSESPAICHDIREAHPHFLAVCLGSPRQEEWIVAHRSELATVPLIMALGGSLDVWSGNLMRATEFWRRMNLEWLWRMLRQPRRFKDLPAILSLMLAAATEGAKKRTASSAIRHL